MGKGSVQFQACPKVKKDPAKLLQCLHQRPRDLSHGDPIASLVTALSDIKLRPRTRQNNKQPSTTRDDARTHTLDTGPDQLPLDTKTELTEKRGEDTGSDISACLASLSKLSINSGQKVHQKDVRKKVPLHTVMLPTKGALRTTSAKSASHHFSYEKRTSQPHGSTMTRPSSVWDGTVGLNELMLLFGKLTVTPTHDPHHNF
ncbi:hypothetical protein BU17DRAFT_96019 [Hysterangium stoloniferum]|nr:hypothetical protein BU17DRAFT_96019 [Hysterangium stoloniferum]